ncbi:hypothetical protein [Jeotgalibaca ciconiae]|uniref:Uncharacterized protein n=1 Tax=Jeotgalibaca ciconiae TaxID=2496265 RepID=A0A3Q9BJM5_9LACT|nr:hypothetical protein [Jeotgalibaca ciconiae]AZP03402.1 hypothetical protein EJN90_01260 [Jeotgalibaca ciconiae]HJB22551.1 hypothetical protein [Candidatus Jeotgalibaca pullicola]
MSNKQLKNATVFTLLSVLYPVYLFSTKEPDTIATISLLLAIFFPIVGVIFGLNVKDKRFKWAFVIINILVLAIFSNYALTILF